MSHARPRPTHVADALTRSTHAPLRRIKSFAQKKVTLPPGRHKVIILDEADSMTEGAQQVWVAHSPPLTRPPT